jgi:hypothetical protein
VGVIAPERERAAPQRPAAPQPPPPPSAPGGRRRVPWGLVALLLTVLALVAARDWVGGLLPSIPNPFAAETVDRSGPAVLHAIQDLREFRAASAHYEVIVDLERDTRLPAAILGERILFVAIGSVDATVDFTGLGGDAVTVSDDRRVATIVLPAPAVSDARLDLERSYVYDRRRGILNTFGGPSDIEAEVYLLGQRRLDAAAREGGDLTARAEANTRALLETLLRSLGFERTTVRFEGQAG